MKKVISKTVKLFDLSDLLLIVIVAMAMLLLTSCAGSRQFNEGDHVRIIEMNYHGYVWSKTELGFLVLVRDPKTDTSADKTYLAHIAPRKVEIIDTLSRHKFGLAVALELRKEQRKAERVAKRLARKSDVETLAGGDR